MDGAGHLGIFRHVFLPLARPAIVNLVVRCSMWSLQDFLWPVIIYSNPSMTTAAQAVLTFQNALSGSPLDNARYDAALVLLAVPAVLLVGFGQRFITSGLRPGPSRTDLGQDFLRHDRPVIHPADHKSRL